MIKKKIYKYIWIFALAGLMAGCGGSQTNASVKSETSVSQSKAAEQSFEVVAEYPHDSKAFTQGLLYSDGFLYESTGLFGESTLRKVDLKSGKVLLQQHLDKEIFAEGLAIAKGKLLQLTWKKGVAFLYNAGDFQQLRTYAYEGEGWGVTSDGKSWIVSDGSDTLTWRSMTDFQPEHKIQVTWDGKPVRDLNELEWINGQIWANVWYTNYILQIDPESGKVLSYLDISRLVTEDSDPENVPNGIAYDSKEKRIFVTGKRWDKLYEIKLK